MDELETVKEIAPAEVVKKIDALNEKAWDLHITQPKVALELSREANITMIKHVSPSHQCY